MRDLGIVFILLAGVTASQRLWAAAALFMALGAACGVVAWFVDWSAAQDDTEAGL